MSEIDDLRTRVTEFEAVAELTPKRVTVDLTCLCPNDPNRQKILAAGGVVAPEDGPEHNNFWLIDITSDSATCVCQKCGLGIYGVPNAKPASERKGTA